MNQPDEEALLWPRALLRLPVYLMFLVAKEGRRQAVERGWRFLIPHLAVLASLEEFGATSQKQLSRRIDFDESDLVDLLRELERYGWVERRKDPSDARRHALGLTPSGRKRLARAQKELGERIAEFLGALSRKEQAQLNELLLRVLAAHDPRVRLP